MAAGKRKKRQLEIERNGSWKGKEMAGGKGEKWQLERNGSWRGREIAAGNREKWQLERRCGGLVKEVW